MPISRRISFSSSNRTRGSGPSLAASSTLFGCLMAGTAAILFQLTLGTLVVAYTPVVPWIMGVFLLGLPLAIGVTRSRPGLCMPAVAIMTLTGVSPAFVVDAPLWGRTVNLRLVDDIPEGVGVAGYAAPRWRIATEFAGEARMSGGRGSKGYGTRRLAPLVGEGWRPELPVEVWVAGEVRDSGRVLASHPQFWNESGGEYVRFVGVAVSGAQIIARDAAKKLGLKTLDEPLIVTRAPSVAGALAEQYRAIARTAAVPLLGWAFCILLAAGFSKWREQRRR
ncbi:hypothetical protein JQ629_13835 [Bradyrhizobium sp. AUGA SZCCT0222]|uniref:hypothetical protein n=1 Tax=Bradyrhizobium sp. AUGA SZCCT0222 TaxID=2807668 RepID=UPI001BA62060|nr:hypothetical protein [Bradyrhizobium sp. AUGA SZCCT0222]MBR1268596.1 hypothetical protein [Bradyrhizobium sp. AUGA SZCCT0222]